MKRLLSLVLVLGAACSSSPDAKPGEPTAVIVLDAPLVKAGLIARQIERGATLAVDSLNKAGGVRVGPARVRLELKVFDSDASPVQSLDNVREAVRLKAVAVIDEGTGVDASWRVARDAGIPIGIVYQGGTGLVDAKSRPNVFRIAPTDRGVSFRLAEYLVPKKLRIAILTDDSTYGNGGRAALAKVFARNASSVAARIVIPAAATDVSPHVVQARQSHATALLVWARPSIVAAVIRGARSTGWGVPVYAATSGEDPIVRQQLSDNPSWVEGLTFTSSRLTSEKGPAHFNAFRAAYEKRFGPDDVGVRSNGRPVVQPPDWAMYAYDFVNVVAAALTRAGSTAPGTKLLDSMQQVSVIGANGDERGFNEINHEGVVDDDVFFSVIRNMVFVPVKDDALSASLPAIKQTR